MSPNAAGESRSAPNKSEEPFERGETGAPRQGNLEHSFDETEQWEQYLKGGNLDAHILAFLNENK